MFNGFYYTAGSASVSTGVSFTTVSTGAGTNTTSIYTPQRPRVLPLQASELEASPGWLSPEGEYYAVRYQMMQRHGQIAEAILTTFMPDVLGLEDEQLALMNRGWVRVDYDSILPNGATTTRKQREALRQLARLDGGRDWERAKELITAFTFKQTKRKKATRS